MKDLQHVGLGFFCSTSDNRFTTNRGFRLSNLTLSKFLDVFSRNLSDLTELLEISRRMNLTIFRLGSNFVPFASHPSLDRSWLKAVEEILRNSAGNIKKYGVRITMHPGQYVVLSSPKRDALDASLRELEYHFWLLDILDIGKEGVVVVHVGGSYGNKKEAMKRFITTVKGNPWLRERLAVENDEKFYNAEEVLWLCERLDLPMVFDHYHHTLNPSNLKTEKILDSWKTLIPEFHLSSISKRFGEHGDWIKLEDLLALEELFSGRRIDVIVEAKKKEKAIERLVEVAMEKGVVLSARYSFEGVK